MKKTGNKKRGVYLWLTVFAICSCANAGAIVLDDFDSTPNNDALGERNFRISILDDPFNQGGSALIDSVFASGDDFGALAFNSGVGAQQTMDFDYDLNNGPIDLLSGGNTTFEFDFLEVDQDFTISIVMLDQSGGKAVIDALAIGAGSNQTISVDIVNDFDFFSMDLSEVSDVRVFFNSAHRNDDDEFVNTASLDFVLTEFRAVPAPGSLALLGLGSFVGMRRRR